MNDSSSGALLRFTLIFSMIFVLFNMRQNGAPLKALQGCETGLKQLGVSLEYYKREHHRYPESLDKLESIPQCPGGESPSSNPFIQGYEPDEEGSSYRLVCRGHRHKEAGIPADYPRIHSRNLESGSSAKALQKPVQEKRPEEEPQPEASSTPEQVDQVQSTPEVESSPEIQASPGDTDSE